MRLVTAATILALVLGAGELPALAAPAAKLRLGVYEGSVTIGGGGHLEVDISVPYPPTNVSLIFDCSKPTGQDTVTEVFDSGPVPTHGNAFVFSGMATLTKYTNVLENNLLLSTSTYKATVHVTGKLSPKDLFKGTALFGGSPCTGVPYSARRIPLPAS
jgi:hypothetical protein